MSKDYGKDAPLSYNNYLRVPELIDLQTCLSSPAQHDEVTTGVKPESSGIVSGFIAASKPGFPKVDTGMG